MRALEELHDRPDSVAFLLPIRSITIVELETPSPLESNLAESRNASNSYPMGFALTVAHLNPSAMERKRKDNVLRKLTQRAAVGVVTESHGDKEL